MLCTIRWIENSTACNFKWFLKRIKRTVLSYQHSCIWQELCFIRKHTHTHKWFIHCDSLFACFAAERYTYCCMPLALFMHNTSTSHLSLTITKRLPIFGHFTINKQLIVQFFFLSSFCLSKIKCCVCAYIYQT